MAGEAAGAAVLKYLVQNLIDLSTNLISLIYGLDGEAQNLIQNLNTIQQFLNDAETRTITSGDVKIWLKRLENAAFEADDVLDELHYHALSSKLNPNINSTPHCCLVTFIDIILSLFTDIRRKRKMGVSIQEINMNFNSINEMATRLGLQKKLADAPTVIYTGVETDSFSADPIFIGRDEVVSEIVETLTPSVATHHQRVFSILPIVGMGGLGKTTLTRKVFHHQKMETQFRSRIWVHVSQVFDPINLFKKILEALPSSQSGQVESKQGILSKLKEALKDKTYLLVLDDVWNEEPSKWDDFLDSLLGVTNTKGNAIIVTTRSKKVASIEGALDIHELKGLSKEDCWKIISAKTFGNEDAVPLDIESVGREIAKRCGGLPLAASVVGGVLRCDKSVDKWVSIRDDWLPEGEEEGENNITKILRLSFNNLSSPSIKKCFAYCSIFPKGYGTSKEELIEMWMGEGFLGSNEDMESVGDKFYNVLLHSSLLQVYFGNLWCGMHDLVHDLASSVLGNADGVSRVRYLNHDERHSSSPITKEVAQHLRTLIFQADQPCDDNIFSDFKSLHVLILMCRSFTELPRSIRKLIHLRNLNIDYTSIGDLPDWIGELHHLQTLRAEYVKKLPSTIKYLINLRHLHVNIHAEFPAEIGRLTSLQTLPGDVFSVKDKNGYKIEELGSLNNLEGSLTIRGLKKVHDKEEAEKANLSKKSKLSELHLEWEDVESSSDESVLESDDDSDESVLESDDDSDERVLDREEVESINDEKVLEGLQPHSNLKKLKIEEFRGKKFPEWSMKMAVRNGPQGSWVGLDQLVEIKFDGCRECEEIPMLGHLPNLKSLCLRYLINVKSINSSFYGIGKETGIVFPALETLELYHMDSLKEWAEVEPGSTSEVKVFPHLQSLKIFDCDQLMKVPVLGHLPNLKSLSFRGLGNVKSINSSFYGIGKETGIVFPALETLELYHMDSLKEWAEVEPGSTSEVKVFPNLQSLIISDCDQLMKVPVLGHLPNLKSLSFWGLRNVKSINSSFYGIGKETGIVFPALETLELYDMDSLKEWAEVEPGSTSEVKVFPHLQSLRISKCNQLMKVPVLGHLPNLKSLSFLGLRNVKSINSSFYGISNETGVVFPVLETLQLCDMDSLKEWAEVESGSTNEVKVFPNLQSLRISNCNQLIKAPTHFSSCLKSLHICGCNQLTTASYLPLLSKLISLTHLDLRELNGLESLPDELFYNNPNLSVLEIRKCHYLREIPDGLQTLNSLETLVIEECPYLNWIGCSSGGRLTSLALLIIRDCHRLMDFPYQMVESLSALVLKKVTLKGLSSLSNLPRLIECLAKSAAGLTELRIVGVPKFMATSVDQVWHFPNLERLVIDVSMEGSRDTSVATLDRILQGCSCDSLRWLYLMGVNSCECLPESIQHLTSLRRLALYNFGMEELPKWFDQFISMQGSIITNSSRFCLNLSECKRLRRLPSTPAMRHLIKQNKVYIKGCPELQQQSDDGSE